MSLVGLGRVKTLEREEHVERCPPPGPMCWRAVTSQVGNRETSRTRFPSVNALSEFLHNQGHYRECGEHANRVSKPSDSGRSACAAAN